MQHTLLRPLHAALVVACLLTAATACGASTSPSQPTHTLRSAPRSTPVSAPSPTLTSPTSAAVQSTSTAPSTSASAGPTGARIRPVIVIDPGHSVAISATDRASGLNVSDYENEPEMRDVFDVAELVRTRLVADGYRVVMTKKTVMQPRSLAQRAEIANDAHAALALSIHDQAGADGGIGFGHGNSIVYSQAVGDWRSTPSGKRIYFTDKRVARLSQDYGRIFRTEREHAQGDQVSLLDNTGYDLGSRDLPGGDIWLVQLLARVPWVYNEAGGNSNGRSGLDAADKRTYADGLIAAVERCVPITR